MPLKLDHSRELHKRALALMPGGVSSPVRAFGAVGGDPPFLVRGLGARVWDADDNEYIDYVGSWGPLILGHAAPEVVAAVEEAARKGTSFGASTPSEADLAEVITDAMPTMEKLRFVNSGTEATMSVIRLARAFTGRKYILKFEGCYHGHADSLLVKAGSGVATLCIPGSAGVLDQVAQFTVAVPYNNIEAVQQAFQRLPGEIAAIIVEPVAGNMGCVPPAAGFLDALRYLTSRNRTLLIFDEVMTGFRLAFGGAQGRYGVVPDLTTLGKIIGGGLPVGAYGGPAELMDMVAPLGPVYQAGTLSGNPLAMAAGLATLRYLRDNRRHFYNELEERAHTLVTGITEAAHQSGCALTHNRVGSMFTWFLTNTTVQDFATAGESDLARFGHFHRAMLELGVFLPPSQFEACFLSAAHTD
ncbi:MAG: glutamate-1-semialdehyde 2,1-aminomutase, partial [Terriglobales bacterium]